MSKLRLFKEDLQILSFVKGGAALIWDIPTEFGIHKSKPFSISKYLSNMKKMIHFWSCRDAGARTSGNLSGHTVILEYINIKE